MDEQKEILRKRFSAEYRKYYLVDLFRRKGFVRKKCENCGKYFWTLNETRKRCDDQPCSPYTFIGNPPTEKKLDYVNTWKTVERFFVAKKHASIKRYPVVSRWRPDLFFTVASIIDFQRIEGGKVVFQLPANPLIVPQMCLRFNDTPSVGVSGKHYTSFCMLGQTSIAGKGGYWKDRCIDLDFELLTKSFGVEENEVSFIEEVWLGYGAFGYSLEYFVRGLELGNAVFTSFEGTPSKYTPMKERVVDMGAGLERLTWLTQGTPTSYDSNFADVLKKMKEVSNVEYDEALFLRYSRIAGAMNLDDYKTISEAREVIAKSLGVDATRLAGQFGPLESMYAVADHARTLLFAITDGMLPSNSGGGYNLRVLFRRAQNFIRRYGFRLTLGEVANWHIDYLSRMYPELAEHREDVGEVLSVEEARYTSSSDRVAKIVASVSSSGQSPSTEQLVQLYDSEGVTPEQLSAAGVNVSLPENFYDQVLARHATKQREVEEERPSFEVAKVAPTKLLFYDEGAKFEFKARVLKVFEGKYVVLDRTAFYPRGGGQEPDHGRIGDAQVTEVVKYGDVVIHTVVGKTPRSGTTVDCQVDGTRRRKITQIHTATHILNGSSRQVLGPWVWQHSAFKEEDYGRLDITHFAHLTQQEVEKIEDLANEVVRKNLPVNTSFMPRQEAEEKYGFRIYQGGIVPTRSIRIVNIGNWDIEACGGTHAKRTGDVGLVKITKVERVQDGVERLEFVAGESAIEYAHRMDSALNHVSATLETQRENIAKVAESLKAELEAVRAREKALGLRVVELSTAEVLSSAKEVKGVKLYVRSQSSLSEELIIAQGQKCTESDPSLVYVSVFVVGNSARVVCFVGAKARESGLSAGDIARQVASVLGGSGGGSAAFAQGGGPSLDRIEEAVRSVEGTVASLVRG